MSYVLTFVAGDPVNNPLTEEFPAFLQDKGYTLTGFDWLEPQMALDIFTEKNLPKSEIQNMRNLLMDAQIDVFFMPVLGRRKKLLLADMDSTIVVGETLDELAAFAGMQDRVAEITRRAMNGEIDFQDALRERVGLLKTLSIDALEETASAIQIMRGAKELVETLKDHDAKTVLVTGGFTYFADDIGAEVGFDFIHGNRLEIEDDLLTGFVIPPILDKNSKLSFLKEYTAKLGLDPSETLAIGDGANDLPMLEAAGLGIGYQCKELLKERLVNIIQHGDLRAVLYAQGYKNIASE